MKKYILLFAVMIVTASVAEAKVLELRDFLDQVRQNNESVKGAVSSSRGASERSAESNLIFAPSFFAQGFSMDDKRDTIMEAFLGDETKAGGAELGFSRVMRSGTAARLTYGIYDTRMFHANTAAIPQPKFIDTSLQLELSQPLWQNSFGRQYRNMEKAGNAQAKASSYAKLYEAQIIMLDAEIKYIKLAGLRESVKIIETTLERTESILAFNKTKQQRGLTDISDVLQCEAAVKARKLDLISALSEEKEAMQALNAARKFDSDTVEEDTPLPAAGDVIAALSKEFPAASVRNDVRAAQSGTDALTAANEISKEKTIPDLSLFAVPSVNSRKDFADDSVYSTFNSKHPYYEIGFKLSVPLDAQLNSKVKNGYLNESKGAEMSLSQKKYGQEREWRALLNKIKDARERLIAAMELEQAQLVKLEKERERQKQGQSVMFQVFVFEQEYLASQLNLVTIKSTALGLLAQAKLYEVYDAGNGGVQ